MNGDPASYDERAASADEYMRTPCPPLGAVDAPDPVLVQFNGIERETLEDLVRQLSDDQMEVLCEGSGDIKTVGEITRMLPDGVDIVQFTEALQELLAVAVSELGSTAWGKEVARLVYAQSKEHEDYAWSTRNSASETA